MYIIAHTFKNTKVIAELLRLDGYENESEVFKLYDDIMHPDLDYIKNHSEIYYYDPSFQQDSISLNTLKNTRMLFDVSSGVITFKDSKLMILLSEDDENFWGDGFIYKDKETFEMILENKDKKTFEYETKEFGTLTISNMRELSKSPRVVSFIKDELGHA